MVINWRRRIQVLIYGADVIAVIAAFFTAYFLRNRGPFRLLLEPVQPLSVYLDTLPLAILLLVIVFSFAGLYDPTKRNRPFTELYLLGKATTNYILLIMAGSYLSKYDYSRIIVLLFYGLILSYTILARNFLRLLEQSLYRRGLGLMRILIIGVGKHGRELARKLQEFANIGYCVVGFLANQPSHKNSLPVLGKLADLSKVITQQDIQEVYIADATLTHTDILDLIGRCQQKQICFKVVSNLFDLVSGGVNIASLESIPSLELWRAKSTWWGGRPKRVFDFCCSLLVVILTVPLWGGIALAIYLESGKPIILQQKRVGLDGKLFALFKFRTMLADRITAVGQILRKTSLDELPQLVNILKGEMSLVGPRPELPRKVAKYNQWQRMRLQVKPGLTGLWQILGRKDLPLEQNLEYDFYYINNQSFFLDMLILLKTIPTVLSGRGAY